MIIFCCVKYKVKSSYYSTTPYANMQQKAIKSTRWILSRIKTCPSHKSGAREINEPVLYIMSILVMYL